MVVHGVLLFCMQTIYVPDKDYVWSEPSTPPSPQCSASQDQNEESSADTEDKSDSTGMLDFTYPVSISAAPTRRFIPIISQI